MEGSGRRTAKQGHRWTWTLVGISLCILLAGTVVVRLVIARAEPILRARVIETLSNRFQSRVELTSLDVSVMRGLEVSGSGLKIYGDADPNPYQPGVQALISLQEFHFHTGIRNLFRPTVKIDTVYVKGMELNIPPRQDRREFTQKMRSQTRKISVIVGQFVCEDTKLLINTLNPDKPPLEFAISNLKMKDIGRGEPLRFEATLVNPKPVGDIQSTGLFGPWHEDDPRETPVQGGYSFSNADLATLKGIGGILSSTGKYEGTLSSIVVDGTTDTPDFRIATSGHAMALHTEFHAIVDGTSGDTQLKSVRATLPHSSFTATGAVTPMLGRRGHDIELDVVMDHARIEDLLKLGVRTDPPVMDGPVEMQTKLSLPAGEGDVADRLKLAGTFHVFGGHFTNEKVQDRLNAVSLRTMGKLKEKPENARENVPVDLGGAFTLKGGLLSFSLLHFLIPGTHVDMTGDYSLDGKTFDFRGTARLDAKLSQMTTGWKSLLLKPVDRFFSKDGAGTEVPVRITGTESEPHFGLDYGHKDEHKAKDFDSAAKR
ncbi:MAG: hypothetical protein WAM04_19020 [Candidatus Sulfotelmatobacter sp.]